ncbi:DUF4238 domain-containing protein [Salinimicrobium marinum]|nr:DUF4238 domain-containing protein [Salinimicrobium marinum]
MKKKRQHYVWRNYLRSWSNSKDIIPALIKKEKKIATPNLMGVAQEKFYYSLVEFTVEEEIVLKQLISNLSNDDTKEIYQQYFDLFTTYSRFKRILESKDLPTKHKSEIEEKLDLMKINLMEDFHSDFESFGHKLMLVQKPEDLMFLEDEEYLIKTLIFLCFQYVRTKKMKNTFSQKFENHLTILPKYFHVLSFVLATGMANGLRFYKQTKFIFIENISKVDFITSDQPITNLLEDERDELGNIKSLEFYYPLSPKVALKIHYKDEGLKFDHIKATEEKVNCLNHIVFNRSEDFIFACTTKELENYKNCL